MMSDGESTDGKTSETEHDGKSKKPDRGIADGHTVSGEPSSDDDQVTEALEESFPASDPPSYITKLRPGAPRRP